MAMSEGEPRRRNEDEENLQHPITYGDVYDVGKNLAAQPITPQDASLMQSAETKATGRTPKAGEAAAMQSAAHINQRGGFLDPMDETLSSKQITIGEALEAAADSSEDKPVEASDVAAIQAAESRATGFQGGVTTAAQSAANINPLLPRHERRTLGDVLSGASLELSHDKAVTWQDARAVKESEEGKSAGGRGFPGGVGDAMEAAARINEGGGRNT